LRSNNYPGVLLHCHGRYPCSKEAAVNSTIMG
jgi:hypothetical protein